MTAKPVPEGMFQIPAGTKVENLPHYGAQFAIQAIMMALGTAEFEPGKTGLSTDLLMRSLAMAQAMMIAADERNATPGDVRRSADEWAKMVRGFAKILREENDLTGAKLLAILGLEQRDIPLS